MTNNGLLKLKFENGMHIHLPLGVSDRLEKLLKEQKIIRTLTLRHNGKMARSSGDVRLKDRKDFNFAPELEITSIDNSPVRGTTLEYEGLD